jgi:hypothetical protein
MGIAVIINWYGPYSTKADLARAMKETWGKGEKCLYMASGVSGRVRYLGRTDNPAARLANHEKMADAANCSFYCAEIDSQGVSGPRSGRCQPDLDIAERTLIALLRPELNERGTRSLPGDCVVIYSRFFDAEDGFRRVDTPPGFPQLIAYDGWTDRWDAGLAAETPHLDFGQSQQATQN